MSVRVTELGNGMRVATDTMDTVETVSLGTWVETGSRDEAVDVCGISHLLEHMVFKGTERRNAREIAEEIEAVGGHLNAYTSRENTAYYAKVLKEDINLAVDLVSDIFMHATMDPAELEREKSVICQEIHQAHDTPDDVVFDLFQEVAYPDQAIGRPVLGTEDVINGFTRDDVQTYRQQGYTAPATVFCAAGRVDHTQLVDLVGEAFEALPSTPRVKRNQAHYHGGDSRIERDLEQVHIVLGLVSATKMMTSMLHPFYRLCSVAACHPACFRKCAKSVASHIRSIRFYRATKILVFLASMQVPGLSIWAT